MRGTRSRLKLDYSHQKRLLRLFDEHSEVFCEAALHKKCGVFLKRAKKSQDFFHAEKTLMFDISVFSLESSVLFRK